MSKLAVLRETLEITLAQDDTFPRCFYEHLFTHHPAVRALFHRSTEGAQQKMFAQKLTALVDHLEDDSWLARELPVLAASHVSYGVTADMYPWVGDALLATLREACGAQWTEVAERAWTDAYARLSGAILAALPTDPAR